jgi:hypothetical protein
MSEKPRRAVAVVANVKRAAPVRVRLKRINCNQAEAYPPDLLFPTNFLSLLQ